MNDNTKQGLRERFRKATGSSPTHTYKDREHYYKDYVQWLESLATKQAEEIADLNKTNLDLAHKVASLGVERDELQRRIDEAPKATIEDMSEDTVYLNIDWENHCKMSVIDGKEFAIVELRENEK